MVQPCEEPQKQPRSESRLLCGTTPHAAQIFKKLRLNYLRYIYTVCACRRLLIRHLRTKNLTTCVAAAVRPPRASCASSAAAPAWRYRVRGRPPEPSGGRARHTGSPDGRKTRPLHRLEGAALFCSARRLGRLGAVRAPNTSRAEPSRAWRTPHHRTQVVSGGAVAGGGKNRPPKCRGPQATEASCRRRSREEAGPRQPRWPRSEAIYAFIIKSQHPPP